MATIEYQISDGDISQEIDHCWIASLPRSIPAGDSPHLSSSSLRLFENGKEIGAAHSFHSVIRNVGLGNYSHWQDRLYFSTSDNSNPLTNGRTYIVRYGPADVRSADATGETSLFPLVISAASPMGGMAWTASLPVGLEEKGDTPHATNQSRLIVYENDSPLGPAHAPHDDIRSLGKGRFSHWGAGLVFSTSDNSDPNTNGRVYKVEVQEKPVSSYLPETLHLNLTTLCNLNCQICRPPDFMKFHKAENLADEYIEHVINEVFPHLKALRIDSSGEPLISKNFKRVIEAATAIELPVHIQTNGTFLRQDMVDFLVRSSVRSVCISLDSPNRDTLEWIRTGANFDRIMAGVERLARARKNEGRENDMTLQFHGALLKQNQHDLPGLLELSTQVGIDGISLAYGFIHDYMNPEWSVFWDRALMNRLIDEASALADERSIFFSPPMKFDLGSSPLDEGSQGKETDYSRTCSYLYGWSYIYPSGKVYPCCVGMYELGDLGTESFKQIWNGYKYQELRETHNTATPAYDKCSNCYLRGGWQANDYKSLFGRAHWSYVEEKLKRQAAGN